MDTIPICILQCHVTFFYSYSFFFFEAVSIRIQCEYSTENIRPLFASISFFLNFFSKKVFARFLSRFGLCMFDVFFYSFTNHLICRAGLFLKQVKLYMHKHTEYTGTWRYYTSCTYILYIRICTWTVDSVTSIYY